MYNGDADLNKIESERSEVKAIYRCEVSGAKLAFQINTQTNEIEVTNNGVLTMAIPQSDFSEKAHSLFEGIQQSKKTFPETVLPNSVE